MNLLHRHTSSRFNILHSSPDKQPYVQIGDSVEIGKTVCMIEAMKLFNEIESEVKGTIVKVMVEDATPVEYDQVLFLVQA